MVVEILGVVQMMIDIGSKSRIESLEMQHDPVILDKMPRGAEGKWWPGPRGTERPDIYSTLLLQYIHQCPALSTGMLPDGFNSELTKLVRPLAPRVLGFTGSIKDVFLFLFLFRFWLA